MSFKESLPIILIFEGGYANDKDDPGGPTNYGVTQKTYDAYLLRQRIGSKPVKQITKDEVEAVYYQYYKASQADDFDVSHPNTALCHFDCAINQGPGTSKFILQRAINFSWKTPKITVDGVIGPKTLEALGSIEDAALLKEYLQLRKNRYDQLIQTRPVMEKFRKSWYHRLNIISEKAELTWRALV